MPLQLFLLEQSTLHLDEQCLQTFADAHSDQAWGVAFDPSAGRFASVGDDKAVRVFEATTVRSGA